jgi:flavodoxin
MKILVLYDSLYGNTYQIAQAIASQLGSQEEVALLCPAELDSSQLSGLRLLVVGSPTQRFRATPALSSWLKAIPKNSLHGVKVTAFDTRLTEKQINATPVLPFFVRIYGYAARPIAELLKKKGGELILPPEGFYVEGMEGPLLPGELERAGEWAQQIRDAGL